MNAVTQDMMKKFSVNQHVTSFIDGNSVSPSGSGEDIPVISPITEGQISLLREASIDEVDHAVRNARDAFENGPWRHMSVDERKAIMLQIRDVIAANADELAYLESLNAGLTLNYVKGFHVKRAGWNFEFFAEVASQASGEAYTQTQPYLSVVTREPIGVGALIGPWNAPLALCSMKVASCIAFGNTCVLKPSEFTPLSLRRVVELIHETDIPKGVVNLVNGRGHVTGDALVSHPEVDVVSFTGGTKTGAMIAARAGEGLKPVGLELGGKSANIITATADMDRALDGAILGIYSNNGQQCLAGSRILVERSIADELIEKFVARSKKIKVGDPMDGATEIGPVCYRAHMDRVLSFVDIAKNDGGELLTGGSRDSRHETGLYLEPTAVMAKSNDAQVCQEEIFGPFATFLTYDDIDEALAIANASEFGLVGYIWSDHLPTVMKASQEMRAGTIWVNTPMTRELRAPFGGYKKSGIGRDSAKDCLQFFTEEKTTTIPMSTFPLAKWGASD
ncbi:MAG: aldehyde dehydrogenase [Rhodospirillaceae bacterium]|nr:aldehyde dehydrogenase [Rhodospirillaceae bacterium]